MELVIFKRGLDPHVQPSGSTHVKDKYLNIQDMVVEICDGDYHLNWLT